MLLDLLTEIIGLARTEVRKLLGAECEDIFVSREEIRPHLRHLHQRGEGHGIPAGLRLFLQSAGSVHRRLGIHAPQRGIQVIDHPFPFAARHTVELHIVHIRVARDKSIGQAIKQRIGIQPVQHILQVFRIVQIIFFAKNSAKYPFYANKCG